MSGNFTFVCLTTMESNLFGFNSIRKIRNKLKVSNDLKTWKDCPEGLIEYCETTWNNGTEGK